MTDERKLELFDEMIEYLGICDTERCISIVNYIGMTKEEAKELHFLDFIVDSIREE